MPRAVTHRYVDPLSQVWLGAARRIGLRVVRTPDAYAATDGRGTLAIGDDATLDAELAAWAAPRNADAARVHWRFTTSDARIRLHHLYPQL